MPRIQPIGKNVDVWYDEVGEGTSTVDICRSCNAKLKRDPHAFDDVLEGEQYQGDPVPDDGWFAGVEHPPYNDYDIDYDCAVCGKHLNGHDN